MRVLERDAIERGRGNAEYFGCHGEYVIGKCVEKVKTGFQRERKCDTSFLDISFSCR